MAECQLDFLEAAYAWEKPEDRWLRGVLDAAVGAWGAAPWACAFAYDASDVTRLEVGTIVFADDSVRPEPFIHTLRDMPPEFVARMYRTGSIGFGRPVGVEIEPMFRDLEAFGGSDIFGINGLDPSGLGCLIAIGTARRPVAPDELVAFQRMSAHLSSAYRCRRRLKGELASPFESSEAILDASGRLLEARGPATTSEARDALGAAARTIVRLRTPRNTEEPLSAWRPRTEVRWTLVDAFESNGERYIVARENRASAPGLASLTEREQEIVCSLAGGRTTKEIAYELGISDATVRVLLARACKRLGVRSRSELFELPSVKAMRGEPPTTGQ
jgi:DNA-binding CsgD family transcriptional regulator